MLQFVFELKEPFLGLQFGWSIRRNVACLAAYIQDGLSTKPVQLMR